jgi:subtilase family serine protease
MVAVPAAVILGAALLLWLLLAAAGGGSMRVRTPSLPLPQPAVSDWQLVSTSTTPPTQADCNSAGRRCFFPQSVRASYNVGPLYAQGLDGTGQTIAIIDSFGSDTIAHDLHVYDQAWGLPAMCGEEGVTCAPGMPTFSQLTVQGSPPTNQHPAQSNGTGQQTHTVWALEVSLDVEVAHAMAPGANILLVTTPNAETLGVQGFPQMMNAEQYVVDHHLANVISQSLAAAEPTFPSTAALMNLRHAFISAAQNGVTVLGASGDGGTANVYPRPTKVQPPIPFPSVEWPASDPLVTGVGGTYLCTDATNTTARVLDLASPPAGCQPGVVPPACQGGITCEEVGWIDSGGGFSQVFGRPSYQDALPAGSTAIGATRGVPDIAFQASSRTGGLVYISLPPDGNSGLICQPSAAPCSTGWYDIGGTSLATPQWAALVAIADQLNGGGLGLINPALYKLASDPTSYTKDFFDVTAGNNGAGAPAVPGYPATTGWDPVTGLGTPDAANLIPDLVAASH